MPQLRFALFFLLFQCGQPCCAAEAPLRPAIETFFENPAFSGALLAPNGKLLAVRIGAPGRRDGLAVVDLAGGGARPVARFADADINHFQWVNNERLVFDLRDRQLGQGELDRGPGMFAVNSDGSNLRQLVSRQGEGGTYTMGSPTAPRLLPWRTALLSHVGAQDSEFIYVASPEVHGNDVLRVGLLRLNTVTGRSSTVSGPPSVHQWLLDQQGVPRLAVGFERDQKVVYYRDPAASDAWRELARFPLYGAHSGQFEPLAFGPDGSLYVDSAGSDDMSAVRTLDLASGKVNPKALITTTGYDFRGRLITNQSSVLGMRFLTDTESTMWFDPAMKAVQAAVDAKLPATVNLVSVARRAETPWVLVEAFSDVLPRTVMLYNTQTGKLDKVGDTYPSIVPAQMGHQEMVRYKARDGLEIPAWLTLPPGEKRTGLPLVVLVHGGPYVRGGQWGWKADAQFLATRGYAVLEPEYRGSTGFGAAHFRAGFKQWGLAMQDDIADGARWAIAKGLVDPKRICIAGASYGGYAVLMGLLKDPDLFRCGIDWVGVTDINLLYTGHWSFRSDLSERWKDYGMPELVGDPVKDAEQLKATSPLLQAARITQPLLMAYGGADRRVPLYHGKKFYDAVKATNPRVEWIEYPEEGHGWALSKNRIDFWGRVEKFLDREIGKGPQ
ncbi:MAG: prolyl oligopeptidase family serine peptidase [Pseudomonadota bacterium]